ncbi:hypothetical protein NWE55_13580 [Myroides albus]|uniref:hypothetical protein n=1 Tax=Myroides albus TaxID=2562892 RepID=UPI0021598FCC|nr:hypothetical protein [Myroides albus]UVD79144.1 hypothetical protein NWE55_13580 [Myroides albus]
MYLLGWIPKRELIALKREVVESFVETLDSSQLVQIMLIENNNDFHIWSEYLNCSVYSLQRIEKGRSYLTSKGEDALRKIVKELFVLKASKRINFTDNFKELRLVIFNDIFKGQLSENRDLTRFETTIDLVWEELD